jgi:hypothetical protein
MGVAEASGRPPERTPARCDCWHYPLKISASLDEANLVSRVGLVPVMGLAERAGLAALVRRHVTIAAAAGVNAAVKAGCLVAGAAAGADSVDDMGAPRGALLYRPRSGLGMEEVSEGPDGLPGSVRKEGP